MNILVSNDDGIQAEGLRVLVGALSGVAGNKVYVCAPDGQRSACGHGISMREMIRVHDEEVQGAEMALSVSGTPADAVKFGIRHLKKVHGISIDVVFSGINHGGNIGSDVHYSGTVSAAAEGLCCGVPAVAVSVGTHRPTGDMLQNCVTVIQEICAKALPELAPTTLLNVNVPALAADEIKGLRVTKLGPREYDESFEILLNPRKEKYFWYSGKLVEFTDLEADTDTLAQQEGYVSITPLKLDLTDYALLDAVRKWDLQVK